jgi:outer membrane biosynthesis protein TonB
MDKKNKITFFKWGIVLTAILLMVTTVLILMNPVFAQGQETCPATGDWVKIEGLSGKEYIYTAPEGKLIAETCYKAGTEVEYDTISPPQKTVTVTSTVGFDLSHASFRLVDEPQPSPTPTDEPTPSPTPTDEPTPSPTPTDEPTPSPTPTDEPTPSPTPTDEPTPSPTPTDEPTPSPTPTDEPTPSPTPTDEPTPNPTPIEELDFEPLILTGICSGSVAGIGVFQASEETITWTVSNENDIAVSFNWLANNGQSGSGTAPANGSANFVTDIDGYAVELDYVLGDETMEEQASIEPCEPQQETEEPTPTATEEPTEEPEATEDPEPDQPAGGMGPSIISTIIPFALGLTGIAAVATIVMKNKKETIS